MQFCRIQSLRYDKTECRPDTAGFGGTADTWHGRARGNPICMPSVGRHTKISGMKEIVIGDVRLVADDNSLTIARLGRSDVTVSFDSDGVRELIDFANSLADTEFNRRRTFRVPLWNSCGLAAQMCAAERQVSVTPTSISLTGISVVLSPDHWIDLPEGAVVEVTLNLEGESEMLHGIVRQCTDFGYGLSFAESTKGERIEPPPTLAQIVMDLQRRWMIRRMRHAQ